MTDIQEQYTDFLLRGQQATQALLDAWTRSVQNTTVQVPTAVNRAAALELIDQSLDFAAQVLDVQRNLVKQLINSTADLADDAAAKTAEAFKEATATTAKAAQAANRAAKKSS